MFTLSLKSMRRLDTVDKRLQDVVMTAITRTKVDFGVACGIRTQEYQKELVDSGASQTMDSKHLTGEAVDLVAYIGSRVSWEISLYDDIAEAVREACKEQDVSIRWGAAWNIPNIADWPDTMEAAMNNYIDVRRRENRRPFIDGPHFELS